MAADGFTAFQYADAARSNATIADSQVGTPGTGIDGLMNNFLGAYVNANPGYVSHVLMNWGVNDMAGWPLDQTTWQNQYLALIDYTKTRFPNAQIYISYPWRQGFDAISATMHGWVDNVIAARSSYVHAGVDEAVTIKGSDDGCSETENCSGVHYSVLGAALYAAAMKALLGY